jgi:Na+/H+ antiporter NhaD/arsenite permease-like protein
VRVLRAPRCATAGEAVVSDERQGQPPRRSAELLVVDRPELERRQAVLLGPGAKRSLVILATMVVLLVPPAVAGLLAAGAIVVSGVLTIERAHRGVPGRRSSSSPDVRIPLSTAMTDTGAAQKIADAIADAVGGIGPHALLLGLVLLTFVLGQLISNMATTLIPIPISISAAADLQVSAKPLLMAVCVAAAAAFLTPVATPSNLMVMEPGGYRLGDYWKLGLPLLALFGVVAVLLVPVIWSF